MADPWRLIGGAAYDNNAALAHSGSGYAVSGTSDGTLSQQFSVPANVTEADLSFWISVRPGSDYRPGVLDVLHVDVVDVHGAL